ncbi:MAG: hypothetical protein WBY93_22865 [Candidatus Binatus sp.]
MLNEQRDIFEQIARLPFAEADDLRHAATLNQLADNLIAIAPHDVEALVGAKGLERESRNISVLSVGARK